jgi:hypothetical protein
VYAALRKITCLGIGEFLLGDGGPLWVSFASIFVCPGYVRLLSHPNVVFGPAPRLGSGGWLALLPTTLDAPQSAPHSRIKERAFEQSADRC